MAQNQVLRNDLRLAKRIWGNMPLPLVNSLVMLLKQHCLSVSAGDLILLDGKWYVTHSGLLRIARKKRCRGMRVAPVENLTDRNALRFAFRATVFTSPSCKGFEGYGDADPSNVSELVHGAEMRVAETRAVNRALRKAYGIGICSVEEIGSSIVSEKSQDAKKLPPQSTNGNYGGPKVRDRLCQLIRKHQLDATLVKSYATDFCGVKSLREASREQVENFLAQLTRSAENHRDALLCQLNSYLPKEEQKDGVA